MESRFGSTGDATTVRNCEKTALTKLEGDKVLSNLISLFVIFHILANQSDNIILIIMIYIIHISLPHMMWLGIKMVFSKGPW